MTASILIVDDSLTVRMDLKEALESAGFKTLPCANAKEARHALGEQAFAIILLDVLLPDADGIDLLKEVRESPRNSGAFVMLLSSEAEVKDRIRGLATGADEYIGKPYDPSYVVARAREFLRRRGTSTASTQTVILVIDDSATFRAELKTAFEGASYGVLTAATGEEGLRIAAAARPTAIVVDGVLPGIDGATVIRSIRLDTVLRRTPCVLLTGSEDQAAELRALDAGADAFVRKEEDVVVILARLAAVLRSAGARTNDECATSLLGPKKILAVDDSQTYLHTLADVLRAEGYEVMLARSGEEALELLAVQPVDCILLDLLMPGLGGNETCRRIKAAPIVRDIPLVMLTALDDREAMIQGLGAGADDYIAKSSDQQVLKARVLAQIRRKQFEDENRRFREQLLRKEREASEARAARELAQTRAVLLLDLERKNKELESFSYAVSHDLRSPLRTIAGFGQALLEDNAAQLDAQGQEHLRRICAATKRMGELIDDLLKLSRAGSAELRHERIDLSALAGLVVEELRKMSPDRDVQVAIEDGLVTEGDAGLLRVVFDNLLGNAWKFTAKTAEARIAFARRSLPDGPAFVVEDNGAGFPMSHVDKLFAPFQRLHDTNDYPGTGIGLATVQRAILRHGGRIWAESEPGRGARFFFTVNAKNKHA